jgi:hypothetical protein
MTEQTTAPLSNNVRRETFAKENFFASWRDLCRCTRDRQVREATSRLTDTEEGMRLNLFKAIAGKLSGSESAFLIWEFNLMNDDPERNIGQAATSR